jgi:hypothetical protein
MTSATRWRRLLLPYPFAVLPALFLAAANPGKFALADLAIVLTASLTLCGLLYGLAALALRSASTRQLVPIVTLALVGWIFLYRAFQRLASESLGALGSHRVFVTVGIVITVGVMWWLTRRPLVGERLTRAFTDVGVALVVWSLLGIAVDEVQAGRAVDRSALRHRLLQPVVAVNAAAGAAGNEARDLYLILLDERANSAVMGERFGFDDRAFEDSLRQLGFTFPRLVHSNYVHTTLSLTSLLSFTHLTELPDELGAKETDPSLPNELLQENRAVRFLRSRGYRFVFFPSQWWPSTRHMRNADEEVDVWRTPSLSRALTRSDLRRNMRQLTPLEYTSLGSNIEYADYVRQTFDRLKNLPPIGTPRFVFAHIVSPHPPVALDAHCRTVNGPDLVRARHPRTMLAYMDQVRCLDSLTLDLVSALLARPRPAPIILLQGDHGTSSLNYSGVPSVDDVSLAQAQERFGAFGAYFLPGSDGRLLADTVTLVNVFPNIFNHYFGTDLPLDSNDLFMSLVRSPYGFRRIELDRYDIAHPGQTKPKTR